MWLRSVKMQSDEWEDFYMFVSLNYCYSPEPIVVPNFFLPPQQLEASLRMLSFSTALPPPATTDQVRDCPLYRVISSMKVYRLQSYPGLTS